MKMEQTERSETPAYEIQTPENYPEETIQNLLKDWNQEVIIRSAAFNTN